jgi:hypothetical protein
MTDMQEELLPDTDRYLGPLRRRPVVAIVAFSVTVVLAMAALVMSRSDQWNAEVRIEPTIDSASISMSTVLPSGLTDVERAVDTANIAKFFDFFDLEDELGVADATMSVVLRPAINSVELRVSAANEERADSVLADLLSAYEADRRAEIDESVSAAMEGIEGRLSVVDETLDILGDELASDLAERSGLARERAQLVAGLQAVTAFPSVTNLGIETVVEETSLSGGGSVSAASLAVALVLAAMAIVGGSVVVGVIDTRVRSRRDLARIAPGVDVVGLIDIEGRGAGPMVLGLGERASGSTTQLVATRGIDTAALVDQLMSAAGESCPDLVAAPSMDESDDAARRASTGARSVVVVQWGRSRDADVTEAVSQLRIAGAGTVELAIVDVPRRELAAALR